MRILPAILILLFAFPAQAFECLNELSGPVIDVQGTDYVDNDWFYPEDGTVLDARGELFTAESIPEVLAKYPIDIRTDGSLPQLPVVCWMGGAVHVTNPEDITWRDGKEAPANGFGTSNVNIVVDGLRVHNAHDAIPFWSRDVPRPDIFFTVRNVWVSWNRDDCIENDWYYDGLVEDSLFDGCYVFLSSRGDTDFGDHTVTVRNNLVRLAEMPGPYGWNDNTVYGLGSLFKNNDYGVYLNLHDNVFLIEECSSAQWKLRACQEYPEAIGFPPQFLLECSGNVIVWRGDGDGDGDYTDDDFPGQIPDNPSCVTVTRDITVWENAKAEWLASHPEVMRIAGVDDVTEPTPEPEPEPEPEPTPEPDYPKGWLKKGLDWICRKFGC